MKRVVPQMLEEPICGFISGLKLSQLGTLQPEADKTADAIVAIANGQMPVFESVDPGRRSRSSGQVAAVVVFLT
ncbi:MAG: hypothetical protein ACI4PO_02045 [Faecousia sp.]